MQIGFSATCANCAPLIKLQN